MSAPLLIAEWAAAAAPPPPLTVSQWAEAHRILPETSAARGAKWRNNTAPYLVGIMDAVHEPGVRKIAVVKCHQSGGSEALNNILGYFIEHDPCPMLFVHPTAEQAQAYSKERLADMIRTTPALAAVVRDRRQPRASHQAESTLALKMFPNGFLALGGANTPNTFARWSVRLALGDDVDRFPGELPEEGDPAELLVNRTTTFHDALAIFVSTPTLKGGRIDTLYAQSDQRRYVVRCPRCGREDWIAWSDPTHFRVSWDERDPTTARIECPDEAHGGCGLRISEPDRARLIAGGGWRPTAEPKEPGLVGFHVPAMLSPWVSLEDLVTRFLVAHARGREALRVFVNTMLAEGWEDRGARMEPHVLWGRREDYGEGVEVPEPAVCLVAGVDVQSWGFELMVQGWGMAAERWIVDWRTVPGDPRRPETRAALVEALDRRYRHALGVDLAILAACIDTGYATEELYDFVLAHQHRRWYATKGFAGRSGEPIVGKPSQRTYGKRARPVPLYPVNVDDAKADVMLSLQLPVPGPGAMHLPTRLDTVNEEFLAQLCAEHRETRYNKAGVATHYVWVQDRDRNEALDCAVLCLAAIRLLNPNLRDMAERIRAAAAAPNPAPAAEAKPVVARPAVRGWTVARSTYVSAV